MFFKSLSIYRLDADWLAQLPAVAETLAQHPLPPITAIATEVRGWSPAVIATDSAEQITLLRDYRNIPATAVKRLVAEKIREHEQARGFRPGRKLLREIKEDVIARMVPQVPVQRAEYQGVIDRQADLLLINTATPARADDFTRSLRSALGTLPAAPIHPDRPMAYLLTRWLSGAELPPSFTVDQECQLVAPDETKAAVRFTRHPLSEQNVTQHLQAGKLATRLALTWKDRISFVIDEQARLRKLQFLDSLRIAENRGELAGELGEQADLTLMVGDLRELVADLIQALGMEG